MARATLAASAAEEGVSPDSPASAEFASDIG